MNSLKFQFLLALALISFIFNNYNSTAQNQEGIVSSPQISDSYFAEIMLTKHTIFAIKNINIIPMNKDIILENKTVIIDNGSIKSIGNNENIQIPVNATVIDGTGRYLMPGLNDMHCHFNTVNDLLLFIANGITCIRNMSGEPIHLELREKINKKIIFGPEIFTAGPYLIHIDDTVTAKKAVLDTKNSGYDYVKIFGYISDPAYKLIFKTAGDENIKVVGHPPVIGGLQFKLDHQQYSVEHIEMLVSYLNLTCSNQNPEDDPDMAIKEFAGSGIWICPTLNPGIIITRGRPIASKFRNLKYIHPKVKKYWKQIPFPMDLPKAPKNEVVKKLHDNGAKLILGTDCGTPYNMPGFSVHEELINMVSAGLTPYEALKTATINASECLGISERKGTVKSGMDADLIILGANPLEDISNTTKIEGVFLKGIYFEKSELDDMLRKLKEFYMKMY